MNADDNFFGFKKDGLQPKKREVPTMSDQNQNPSSPVDALTKALDGLAGAFGAIGGGPPDRPTHEGALRDGSAPSATSGEFDPEAQREIIDLQAAADEVDARHSSLTTVKVDDLRDDLFRRLELAQMRAMAAQIRSDADHARALEAERRIGYWKGKISEMAQRASQAQANLRAVESNLKAQIEALKAENSKLIDSLAQSALKSVFLTKVAGQAMDQLKRRAARRRA